VCFYTRKATEHAIIVIDLGMKCESFGMAAAAIAAISGSPMFHNIAANDQASTAMSCGAYSLLRGRAAAAIEERRGRCKNNRGETDQDEHVK